MPKDDISHLPPEVQAAIKAARQKTEEKEKTYVVQPGDSLSKIAKELLGDAARWPEIFELNKDQIKDPNLIQVGQELRIP
jgi:nucleoid-associated protein YgaU